MTILNEYTNYTFSWPSAIFIFLALVMLILFMLLWLDDEYFLTCFVALFVVVGSIFIAFRFREEHKTYEVLLDDQYAAKEFFDSYIFIEKKGEIYVVEETEKKEKEE